MQKSRETIYIGSGRFVLALDAHSGEERWRTKLKENAPSVITLLLKGKHLFAGHRGRVYCLDAGTGEIVWKNDLPKTGYNAVMLAMEGGQGCASQGSVAANEEAAASAAASACVVAT